MKHLVPFLAALLCMNYTASAATPQRGDTIPFNYNRYIYLHATICDTLRGTFIFDTGAGITMLDTALLTGSGLLHGHTQPITIMGSGSRSIKSSYSTDSIKVTLGNYNKYLTATVLVKLTDLMANFEGIDGVLGIALFNDTIFAIDYKKQTLSLVSSAQLGALTGYEKVPFTRDKSGLMVIDVAAVVSPTKQIEGKVYIDTGNPKLLDFTPNKGQLKKLRKNLSHSISYDVANAGVGGGASFTLFENQELKIGPFTIPMSSLGVIENSSVYKAKSLNGLIGNSVLSKFHVIVDMKGCNLYLKPNENFAAPLRPDYTGVYLSHFPNRLFVNGTSHHKTPLQLGDVITAINGVAVSAMTGDEIEAIFCTPDMQYTLTVLRSDATVQLSIVNLNDTTLWQ